VPYSAALYCNNVFGTRWFVLFGAATCGLSAGLFWGIEARYRDRVPRALPPRQVPRYLAVVPCCWPDSRRCSQRRSR
jgi:hypothetical protein